MDSSVKTTDHSDPQYLNCCNVHVTTVSLALKFAFISCATVIGFASITVGEPLAILGLLLLCIPSALAAIGIHKRKHCYLLPTLIADAFVCYATVLCSTVYAASFVTQVRIDEMGIANCILALFGWFLITALTTWIALVDYQSYKYLKERHATHTVTVQSANV